MPKKELEEPSKLKEIIIIRIGDTTQLPGVDYNNESGKERQRQARGVYGGRGIV